MKRFAKQRSHLFMYMLALLVAALFLPASAMTHKPILVERSINGYEQAYEIPDPLTSYAIYGELKTPRQVDLYKVTVTEESPFYARISVPKKQAYQSWGPAFLIFGPGLPTTNEPPSYPLDLPANMGRATLLWNGEADESYEPFTQTSYIDHQLYSRSLAPGTYYIAVYDPSGGTGRYVLATGSQSRFGMLDWLRFPATWYQIRMWYDPTQTTLLLVGAFALLAGAIYFFSRQLKGRK
ncbi:hypothetical protein [Tumebacillus lipolyticus]|uniref:Peptidase C-terminal archaeal/bacterial domain-containing protein n=1 Tax=Tumebacillus lipolyticus TaxID=1280370 RepID=A0ABW4ZRG2_9BACL